MPDARLEDRINHVCSTLEAADAAAAVRNSKRSLVMYTEAERLLRELIAIDPDDPRHVQTLGSALYRAGEMHLVSGDAASAVATLERAEAAYLALRGLNGHPAKLDQMIADVRLRRAKVHAASDRAASAHRWDKQAHRGGAVPGAGVTAAADGVVPLERAVDAVRRRRERWMAIEQLVAGVTPIPWSPAADVCDDPSPEPRDDWAEVLVQVAAFTHVHAAPSCRGYTTWSSGRTACGCCGWGMSARIGDVGTAGSARFAQAAIARVGQAIALAVGEVVQALFEAVLPC
jgi:hypothetical protein